MNDRRMPEPKSPFTEALRRSPKENAEDAERLYDSPDRRTVTEANRKIGRKPDEREAEVGGDPAVSTNVRKPF
ncbi:hypothetical protein HL658_27580 [Azospirillum sp. RWY-5-1]|uniref:Uncharacterized protein n=1 Tax=Azospirillum oleiclasticum TaxID=2735135 RepID=A0ABX2THI0_9PROT|nr:hypothetical protein [Azospirillum oleiclasticum]NYZ16320.1 hypothetical protein [Azospirillum oleiclasticum]NYZ23807.1 hypothetical protein [Azospirillum oleiclasticum]